MPLTPHRGRPGTQTPPLLGCPHGESKSTKRLRKSNSKERTNIGGNKAGTTTSKKRERDFMCNESRALQDPLWSALPVDGTSDMFLLKRHIPASMNESRNRHSKRKGSVLTEALPSGHTASPDSRSRLCSPPQVHRQAARARRAAVSLEPSFRVAVVIGGLQCPAHLRFRQGAGSAASLPRGSALGNPTGPGGM